MKANSSRYEMPCSPPQNDSYMILHWWPEDVKPPTCSSIHHAVHVEYNQSINLLKKFFLDLEEWTMWDIYCRKRPINDAAGKRLTTDQIYGQDPNLGNHYNFAEPILDSIKCVKTSTRSPFIVLVGSYVREWFGSAESVVRNRMEILYTELIIQSI